MIERLCRDAALAVTSFLPLTGQARAEDKEPIALVDWSRDNGILIVSLFAPCRFPPLSFDS